MRLAAFIGWRVGVEVVRSCRIDFDFVQKMVLGQPLGEDRLRRGTSTNIAHANKQNFDISGVHLILFWGAQEESHAVRHRSDAWGQNHRRTRALSDSPAPNPQKPTRLATRPAYGLIPVMLLICQAANQQRSKPSGLAMRLSATQSIQTAAVSPAWSERSSCTNW